MGCIGESHEGATACLPATPATDTARGASAAKMPQVRDSARCPLYESGLRRPWQRPAGRRVWLLCHQCTHHPPLRAAADVSAGVHLIWYWAWRGLRQKRRAWGGALPHVGHRGGSTPLVGHVMRHVCTRGATAGGTAPHCDVSVAVSVSLTPVYLVFPSQRPQERGRFIESPHPPGTGGVGES
jgi:hypothetical protein